MAWLLRLPRLLRLPAAFVVVCLCAVLLALLAVALPGIVLWHRVRREIDGRRALRLLEVSRRVG